MRIGIDAHFASYELRGMGKYAVQLVSRLIQADDSVDYVIYGDPRIFRGAKARGRGEVRFRNPGTLPYPLWEQLVLPLWAHRDGVDILHCLANTAPIALPKKIKLVITVHDVMYLLPPNVLTASKVTRQRMGTFYRKMVVPRVAGRADCIIADSEFSKREIVACLGIDPGRIRVIHLGIDTGFKSIPDFKSMPDSAAADVRKADGGRVELPFILALGAGDPRKNTLGVIRAYASVCGELPHEETLVIVGLRDWRSSAALRLVRELGLEKQVSFAGYVPEELLAWLYTASSCFLYPTLYEGFGFPVLEAMACGSPVITSDRTSVPEIAGNAALLVDPSSEESIGRALLRVLREEPLRRRLIEEGKARVLKFDWRNTAQATQAVYGELSEAADARAMAARVY